MGEFRQSRAEKQKEQLPLPPSPHLTDESKGLASHPLRTMTELDNKLVDKVEAQLMVSTGVQLLQDLHHLHQTWNTHTHTKPYALPITRRHAAVHLLN